VSYIWVTEGSEKSIIFIKFTKCCHFHFLCGPICPTVPPPPTRLWKRVSPDVLHCRFVHRQARTILSTYSESLFPDGSNDTIFRSLGLFWAEKSSSEDEEKICMERFVARNWQKPLGSFVFTLNDDCSASDRPRDLKMVSLEPSGNEDSEYVFSTFLACLWTKWQQKTSEPFIKSLCDETVVH
jgi:hypothetical protein